MITSAELRTLFLFEDLTDEQLDKIAAIAKVVEYDAQETIFTEGEPATCFVLLLEGTVSLLRAVSGSADLEVNRTDHRGAYAGGVQGLLSDEPALYVGSFRAVTDCKLVELPVAEFGPLVREWFPMAVHLLAGFSNGMRVTQSKVAERERLVALGSVTAGLTHELNNPAAAAARANSGLRDHVHGLRLKLGKLADGWLNREQLKALTVFQEEIAEATPVTLSPLEVSDREDELGDWLEEHKVAGAWDIASTFVAVGLDVAWLERVADEIGADCLSASMQWLYHSAEAESLLAEVDDALTRITNLLGAAKQYSQMDRAPGQRVDVHELLDSTLTMLRHKVAPSISVVTDYDRTLPKIEVRAAELNQVWTNLIDNALDAMDGLGTLTVRTARDGDRLLVEIADTGEGIPPEIQARIFEPFYSTKPVGKGTGLGLDISWRIVVERHDGDLSVASSPGDTRFQVRLPI